MAILVGSDIELALSLTEQPIELRDLSGSRVMALARKADVAEYRKRGYEVHGTKRRVRYVRPPADQRVFDVDCSFWDGRGCIRFWSDQRSAPGVFA